MQRHEQETILGIEIDVSAAVKLTPYVVHSMNEGQLTQDDAIRLLSDHMVIVINHKPKERAT